MEEELKEEPRTPNFPQIRVLHVNRARQVTEQVLLHALRSASICTAITGGNYPVRARRATTSVQVVLHYSALLAALPASECAAPLLAALLIEQNKQEEDEDARIRPRRADDQTLAFEVREALGCFHDTVWVGISIPFRPVRGQQPAQGLQAGLVRPGRRNMVLHRNYMRTQLSSPVTPPDKRFVGR